MAYNEDVNVNLNVLAGTMGGVTAILGGMSALTSSFGAMATEAMSAFGSVDGLLAGTTALLGVFAKQAADAYGEFEQGMKIVQTVSGQAQYSIAQLGEQANQLSVHYRTAIGDITDGLQTLGRAGLNSATTQLEVLESGLQTAKLEGRNLNSVLEELIQNTAMLGGDLKSVDFGQQSEYLNSLMVGTSMTAPITSHDISQTLQYAGGTAAAAGANLENKDKLEDLMGTIAAFAQKGVTGSMSGTALRAFFTKPASQDTSVTEALGTLGLSPEDLWEDGGNSMKKVSDQINIIKRRMDALHMSTIDQVELWGKIVGPKMGQQMMKLDGASVKELTSDIQSASSAEELATKTLHTYNQKLSELGQKGEVAFRGFGEKSVMFLNPVLDVLNAIMGTLDNPAVSTGAFIGFLALMGHGVRALWGMITTLYGQIKGLIMDVVNGVNSIASATSGVTSGFTQSTSQAEVLNAKLMETDKTMQAIQAHSLGINGMNWVANGGAPGDKIEKGIIASMERNMIMGGTSENGLNFGTPGQYYRLSEKGDLTQQMKDQSAANEAYVEKMGVATDKLAAEIQAKETYLNQLTNRIRTYRGYTKSGGTDPELLAQAKTALGFSEDQHLAAYRAPLLLSQKRQELESKLDTMPKESLRKELMKEAGVTEQDIIETRQLIQAKKEAELAYKEAKQQYDANQLAYAKKTPVDADTQPIKNRDAYVRETQERLNAGQFDKTKTGKKLSKQLKQAEEAAAMAKGIEFVDMPLSDYEKTINQVEHLKQLEADIKKASGVNLQKLIQQAETERQQVLIKLRELYAAQGAIPSTAELETMFPSMSDGEIRKLTKELQTKLQTQIQIVEENVYRAEMARLEKLAATNPIAAQTLSDNKELEKAGQSRVKGILGYRQMVTNTAAPEPQSDIVGMATKNQANQNALKMANAMEKASLQASKEVQGLGARIRNKLQSAGQSYTQSWANALNIGAQKIGLASQNVEFAIQGLATAIPEANIAIQSISEEFAMSGMTFQEAMAEITAATGLTSKQIAMLALSEEEAATEWITSISAMIAADDEEIIAIENLVRAKLSEIAATSAGNTGKIMSGLQTVTGFMGGPFMAAMMAFTVASSLYQQSVSAWQKEMSDAANNMSQAKDKLSTAEENIRGLYTSENNQISDADLDKIVDYQYGAIQKAYNADADKHGKKTKPKFSEMYDNEVVKVQNLEWSDEEKEKYNLKTAEDLQALNESTEKLSLTEEENIKKLEENTAALNSASYAFAQALNKEAKSFNDPLYGYKGVVTGMEQNTGLEGLGAILTSNGLHEWFSHYFKDPIWEKMGWKESFFDYNSGVLTQYQSSDNYAGSKEMGPILSLDMYQLGVEGGLRQFFGSDYDSLMRSVDNIDNKAGNALDVFNAMSNNRFEGMDDRGMAQAQMLLKEDPDTMHKLAKQMYWSETEHPGYSAMESWKTGKLQKRNPKENHPSSKDYMKDVSKKKYTVNDKNTKKTLDKIYRMTDTKLSYSNILALGQMQQFADMYQVANEMIYPTLSQSLLAAQQNVLATGTAGTNAGSAASGAGSAANNAAVIARMLGEKLKMEATDISYANDYLQDPDAPKTGGILGFGERTLTKEEYTQKLADLDDHAFDKYRENRFKTEMEVVAGWNHPEWGPDDRAAYAERSAKKILNADGSLKSDVYKKLGVIDDTILNPGMKNLEKMIKSSYEQSKLGEYGGDSGSGGGSGGGGDGGSGGGGSNSGTGSTTNRVDLVLCNKKTIPKLNVNLFKKPPQFTINNKQFSIRDINVNTQDKPDAMVDAVKDSIIKTQQQMDPKIIQDERAIYDPAAATDGTTTPKGKTPVATK